MKAFRPYRIVHLMLEKDLQRIHDQWDELQINFCFFWWKEIPLAHFIPEEEGNDREEISIGQIAEILNSTLETYKANRNDLEHIKAYFIEGEQQKFNQYLSSLLFGFLPAEVPQIVNITVIVCTRNRTEDLSKCLAALNSQQSKAAELIVVDNAPNDESTHLLCKDFGEVKYLREERIGLDIARNTGAKQASTPIIAYLDDDVIPDPYWLYRIFMAFNDPTIDALTGLVLPMYIDTESQWIFEKYWSFNRGYERKIFTKSFLHTSKNRCPRVWEIGAGANMAFRSEVFRKVGYFDDRLDAGAAGCSGDSELWFRILLAGGKIFYDPLAIVFHDHRRDMQGLKQQLHNYMKGNVVASLIQHSYAPDLHYREHVFPRMLLHYFFLLIHWIRHPSQRYKTIIPEIMGMFSGILYYLRSSNKQNSI